MARYHLKMYRGVGFATSRILNSQMKISRCLQTSACQIPSTHTAEVTDPVPKTIFSAIQPTGIPHLGNYLGAMKFWVHLQKTEQSSTKLIFSVADLHALTVPQVPELLRKSRLQTLASMLSVGLDETRCTIFMQSEFGTVTELMWILSCTASLGYLSRMTQWKSKANLNSNATFKENNGITAKAKLGLFSYPVLQAADILIHRATHVPVGADQAQHLEFARECVTNFNATYSPVLVKPQTLHSPTTRIRSLANPSQKMSKSHAARNSRILVTDTKEEIREKLNHAVTDSENVISWNPDSRPGVSNLLSIFSAFDVSSRTPEKLAEDMKGLGLGDLKHHLTETIEENIKPIRERYNTLISNDNYLEKVASRGLEQAILTGSKTMADVKAALGLTSR
ncbi:Bgt-3578 [Blumeria graminis f. sp. tritici]|uniref:tryptophan--tRNA ligase n=2 Tax=Blumeria graminis f. sp. tritici TaxID=62690 RepID=A0A9X9L7G6_BLUGR|nr:Mitochondrial tryptophanyl-tRNA synthetase [Blumeria graminis f. sp. tritici 96224]VCU38799.1 Bgt-3578 [Blumeria graminis f. sp. tritici]